MFHPRSPFTKGSSTKSIVKGKSRIREFFKLEADDRGDTHLLYQEKEFFIPTSENELKIVLQIWYNLLVQLAVNRAIATERIALILDHSDEQYQVSRA